jgi:hypothetical protein
MSGKFRLDLVSSCHVSLCQVRSGYIRLGQLIQVITLCQVRSSLFGLVRDRSGYFMLVQVKWG